MIRRIGNDRFLIHSRDEGKQHHFFFLYMSEQVVAQLYDQSGDSLQLRMFIASLDRQFARHLCESRQFLPNALVMIANNMLNKPSQRDGSGIERRSTGLSRFSIGKLLKELIDRELLFRARLIKRLVTQGAEVNIKAMKDAGCRWMYRNDFADGLR